MESEGDVYAAKVIGQKPTVPGVKKKPRGRQLQSDSLREAYSACLFEPPAILSPASSCMVLSNSHGQWMVGCSLEPTLYACPLDAWASQKHKTTVTRCRRRPHLARLTLARDFYYVRFVLPCSLLFVIHSESCKKCKYFEPQKLGPPFRIQ